MSVQTKLNNANPNNLPGELQRVSIGDIIAGLIPREIARTGLTSSATHVEPEPGAILGLTDGTDEYLITPTDGTPTAKGALAVGIATVAYDAQGVATITFPAAKTAYTVIKQVLPAGLGTILASEP